MERGRVVHSCYIGEVIHTYVGLRGVMDGGCSWYAWVTKLAGVGRVSGDAGALIKCGMKTLMTPDYIAFQERSTV